MCGQRKEKRKWSNRLKPAETYTHTHTHTCKGLLSPKQIGTICFVFSLILISTKSYSDIAANNSNPSCDNSTLNTYTGPAALEAKWNANTIQLKWYKDDEQLTVQTAANQCTYDGTMTLPSTRPTKTGYDFNGWKVKTGGSSSNPCFVGPVCGLTSSLASVNPTNEDAYGYQNDSRGENGANSYKTTEYGLTSDQTWAVEFSHGIVKGTASCNSTPGGDTSALYAQAMAIEEAIEAGTITEEEGMAQMIALEAQGYTLPGMCQPTGTFSTSSTGQYCWCHVESYTPTGNASCNTSSLAWVFGDIIGSASTCAYDCAHFCAANVQGSAGFRAALFGVANN